MSIEIRKVSTAREMKDFIRFPLGLYKDHHCYVPGLEADDAATFDRQRNAAFVFCDADFFLAYKKGKLVGRVAAIINRKANEAWNTSCVRFGWIDFIKDKEVFDALIDTVESWGKERGMTTIAGPLGFTDFDPEGMLVDGFQYIGTMITIYNHRYYPQFFEEAGFRKDVDWMEYRIKLPERLDECFVKMSEVIREKFNLHLRPMTRAIIAKEKYGHKFFRLINEAFVHLYGYSTLTEKQIDQYVNQYLTFLDLRMTSFVEDENGELVAAGVTIPLLSRALQKAKGKLFPFGWFHLIKPMFLKKPDTVELVLVGIKPEYQGKGLNAVIFADLVPRLIDMGFKYAESNPELESNKKVRTLWNSFEHIQHKRRRIFTREIR